MSNLSPMLFNAFINDLQFSSDDCALYKYADDATLIIRYTSENIAPDINVNIITMQKWCDDNELQLNRDKTQIMTISKTTSVIRHPNHLKS